MIRIKSLDSNGRTVEKPLVKLAKNSTDIFYFFLGGVSESEGQLTGAVKYGKAVH